MASLDTTLPPNRVLGIVHGEIGHVLFYAFMNAEKTKNWKIMNCYIRRRCEKRGQEHVDAVVAAYTDICCEGLKDPSKHWLADMWPCVKRAPLKDAKHAMLLVTDNASYGPSHNFHPFF
jgi:hypothetical protein